VKFTLPWLKEHLDTDQPLAPIAEKLTSALPDGRLVRMPGVARLLPEENPDRLLELLLDFMRKRAVA